MSSPSPSGTPIRDSHISNLRDASCRRRKRRLEHGCSDSEASEDTGSSDFDSEQSATATFHSSQQRLSDDLSHFVNNPVLSDVKFECGDRQGEYIYCHKGNQFRHHHHHHHHYHCHCHQQLLLLLLLCLFIHCNQLLLPNKQPSSVLDATTSSPCS